MCECELRCEETKIELKHSKLGSATVTPFLVSSEGDLGSQDFHTLLNKLTELVTLVPVSASEIFEQTFWTFFRCLLTGQEFESHGQLVRSVSDLRVRKPFECAESLGLQETNAVVESDESSGTRPQVATAHSQNALSLSTPKQTNPSEANGGLRSPLLRSTNAHRDRGGHARAAALVLEFSL